MSRVFVPITVDELKKKIEALDQGIYGNKKNLTPQVEKDLGKINFDTENESYEFGAKDMLGYNTLPNGMPYLGVCAGGDWGTPVFFCIYWDGKKLRGYIPEKGNIYNTTTKEAYGNDDDADLKDLRKRFPDDPNLKDDKFDVSNYCDEWDVEAMEKDIMERIVKKELDKPKKDSKTLNQLINALATYSADELLDELRRRLK
jgi:hypothetical protein